jgi:hypothetical protein
MLNNSEFNQLLVAWKYSYGEKRLASNGDEYFVVPVNPQKRRNMFIILIETLMNKYSYTKEDLNCDFIRVMIINACVSNKVKVEALRQWKNAVQRDLDDAMAITFFQDIFPKREDDVD